MSLNPVFYPESIAVIGASPNPSKPGNIALKALTNFNGRIYPVNPNYSEILGFKCYPDVLSIPGNVDLAIITIPPGPVTTPILKPLNSGIVSKAMM